MRDIAWRHYTADPTPRAMATAAAEVRREYGSVMGMIMLQIALIFIEALIRHWLDNRTTQPPLDPVAGEPGYGRKGY